MDDGLVETDKIGSGNFFWSEWKGLSLKNGSLVFLSPSYLLNRFSRKGSAASEESGTTSPVRNRQLVSYVRKAYSSPYVQFVVLQCKGAEDDIVRLGSEVATLAVQAQELQASRGDSKERAEMAR